MCPIHIGFQTSSSLPTAHRSYLIRVCSSPFPGHVRAAAGSGLLAHRPALQSEYSGSYIPNTPGRLCPQGVHDLIAVHMKRLVCFRCLAVQHSVGVACAPVQRGQPLLFQLYAHSFGGVVAVHSARILGRCNSCTRGADGACPVHAFHALLQIIRNPG